LTWTDVLPGPLPPSLSVTVTLMGKLPVGWPAGVSREAWLTPLKVSTPAPRVTAAVAEPSPQVMATGWGARTPGAETVPRKETDWPSLMEAALSVRLTFAGSTFVTVIVWAAVPTPPSLSVAVRLTP